MTWSGPNPCASVGPPSGPTSVVSAAGEGDSATDDRGAATERWASAPSPKCESAVSDVPMVEGIGNVGGSNGSAAGAAGRHWLNWPRAHSANSNWASRWDGPWSPPRSGAKLSNRQPAALGTEIVDSRLADRNLVRMAASNCR